MWADMLDVLSDRPVVVEWGVGGGVLAEGVRRRSGGGIGAHSWKGVHGLRGLEVLEETNSLRAVWVRAPGGTFAKGHRPAVRSKGQPEGFKDLEPKMMQKVKEENSVWARLFRVMDRLAEKGVPLLISHSRGSCLPEVPVDGSSLRQSSWPPCVAMNAAVVPFWGRASGGGE